MNQLVCVRLGFYFFIPDKNKEGPFGGMPQKYCRNLDNFGFCSAFLSFFLTSVDREGRRENTEE
jgi:hypothetical protein